MKKFFINSVFVVAFSLAWSAGAWAQDCAPMSCVKGIRFMKGQIVVEFDVRCPMFQVFGKVGDEGDYEMLSNNPSSYKLNPGEGVKWGDGDHAFQSLTFKNIQGASAVVVFKDEFHWPTAPLKKCEYEMIISEEKTK